MLPPWLFLVDSLDDSLISKDIWKYNPRLNWIGKEVSLSKFKCLRVENNILLNPVKFAHDASKNQTMLHTKNFIIGWGDRMVISAISLLLILRSPLISFLLYTNNNRISIIIKKLL